MTAQTIDQELAAVLICLAPLGHRGLQYVNTRTREFSWRGMLDSEAWSSGEAQLIIAAGALWNRSEGLDLAYVAGLSRAFFDAFVNALAALRGRDFSTTWQRALYAITEVEQ